MTVEQMHIRYKLLLDKADTQNYADIEPEEIDEFLNMSQERFVKQRYGINNNKRASFESSQKRTDDLQELVRSYTSSVATSSVAENKENGFFVSLPADYWFMINEEVSIESPGCDPITPASGNLKDLATYIVTSGTISYAGTDYTTGQTFKVDQGTFEYQGTGTFVESNQSRTGVTPLQHDDYNKVISDPFNKPDKDQVMRLMLDGKVELLSNGKFQLKEYFCRYLKKPNAIDLENLIDCELAEHTHQEIVEIAVSLTLETIESRRYQTNLNELNKQE
jgi:hypothetical protein